MSQPTQSDAPIVDWGIISTILGSIGLMLFFLPILGIPISVCAAVLSLLGIAHAMWGGQSNLRWALVGMAISFAAIGIGLALAYAPIDTASSRAAPESFWAPEGHLYIAPPQVPHRGT